MKDIKIIFAKEEHRQIWNQFVLSHPKSNVYQLVEWERVIHNTYGHRGYYFVAMPNSTEPCGILPIIKINTYGVKKKFISIPFFDLGGILAKDKDIEILLINHAIEWAKRERISQVCLRQEYPLDSIDFVNKGSFSHVYEKKDKVRLILKLPSSSDELFKSFKSKLRSQIRRPIKEGLEVKIGGEELSNDFYKVFTINMRLLGSPVHSINLIKNTVRNFLHSAKIFIVYKDRIPMAASLVVGFKDTLYNPWASSLREYSRLSPNMLLYWEMLKYGCEHGYKFFDFGRSTPGEGTYRFKKQWGAEVKEIFWYIISKNTLNKKKFPLKKDIIINLWSKLPLKATTLLGPRIRKYIDL